MYFIRTEFSIGGTKAEQLPAIFDLAGVIALGYLIRLGIAWIRFLLLGLFLVGSIISIGLVSFFIQFAPIAGIIFVIQSGLHLYAIILLFMKPASNWYKESKSED